MKRKKCVGNWAEIVLDDASRVSSIVQILFAVLRRWENPQKPSPFIYICFLKGKRPPKTVVAFTPWIRDVFKRFQSVYAPFVGIYLPGTIFSQPLPWKFEFINMDRKKEKIVTCTLRGLGEIHSCSVQSGKGTECYEQTLYAFEWNPVLNYSSSCDKFI